MSETEQRPGKPGRSARLIWIAGIVSIAVLSTLLLHAWHREPTPTPNRAIAMLNGSKPAPSDAGNVRAAKFDREIESSIAPGALVFRALKTQFPDDYAAYLRLYADRSGAGAPVDQFQAETQAWLARFMANHRRDLVQSPDAMLLVVVHAQTAAAMALRTASPELCAHYTTTGFRSGDAAPSPAILAALDQANSARVMAMGQGRRHPARAEPTTMADADATAFAAAAIQRGATETDFAAMSTPAGAAAMSSARQCDVGIVMLQAIASLPRDQAGRVAAVVFQDPAKLS